MTIASSIKRVRGNTSPFSGLPLYSDFLAQDTDCDPTHSHNSEDTSLPRTNALSIHTHQTLLANLTHTQQHRRWRHGQLVAHSCTPSGAPGWKTTRITFGVALLK